MTIRFDFVGDHRTLLGESPLWDGRAAKLWWVDIVAPRICRANADGGDLETWEAPSTVGSIVLAEKGLLAALADGFYAFDPGSGAFAPIARPDLDPGVRFNDGKADRQGRFLSGTMRDGSAEGAPGKLYRLEHDGSTSLIESGIAVSNALCFSPSGDTLYFADSLAKSIWAYDYDGSSGAVTRRRTLIDADTLGTIADGATVAADGTLWVALVQAQQLAHISPDGALIEKIDLPLPYPSCPAFGGADLATLFVTSISNSGGLFKSDHPNAGRILAITGHGATGLPESRCPLPLAVGANS
ncbi:MAG: SMP-30/gluconolactonase/LRE family protein [Sphingomicrobium sp.]